MQTQTMPRITVVRRIGVIQNSPLRWHTELITFSSDDEEDETAELLRELEKIKRERAEQKEKEVGNRHLSQRLWSYD